MNYRTLKQAGITFEQTPRQKKATRTVRLLDRFVAREHKRRDMRPRLVKGKQNG